MDIFNGETLGDMRIFFYECFPVSVRHKQVSSSQMLEIVEFATEEMDITTNATGDVYGDVVVEVENVGIFQMKKLANISSSVEVITWVDESGIVRKLPGAKSLADLRFLDMGPRSAMLAWNWYEQVRTNLNRAALLLDTNSFDPFKAYYECWPSEIRGIALDSNIGAVISETVVTCEVSASL